MYLSRFAYFNRGTFEDINANGNYPAQRSFLLKPFEFERFEVHSLTIHINDVGRFNNNLYGVDITLTNGISVVLIKDGREIDLTEQQKIYTNTHWKIYCRKYKKSTYGTGDDAMFFLFDIKKAFGEPVILDGSNGDRIEVRLHDSFSGLTGHYFRFNVKQSYLPGMHGYKAYSPAERSPEWSLMEAGKTITVYNEFDKSLSNTNVLPAGTWYSLMREEEGQFTDMEMSCRIHYEGVNNTFENYVLAKGIDSNNFVGVTSYNNVLRLYERRNGTWTPISVIMPVAGTAGGVVKMIIEGNQVSMFFDGKHIGTATHHITGLAYMGVLLRRHPIIGKIASEFEFKGIN